MMTRPATPALALLRSSVLVLRDSGMADGVPPAVLARNADVLPEGEGPFWPAYDF